MAATTGIGWTDAQKKLARAALNSAVRSGLLPRPNDVRCTDCPHVWLKGLGNRHEYDHHKGYDPEHYLVAEVVCKACHVRRDNKRAKQTHCIHGHEFTKENTIIKINGCRQCRECRRAFDREKRTRPPGFWARINANRKHLNYGKGA